MKNFFFLLFIFIYLTPANAAKKEYIVMHSRNEGMFGVWMDVLAMCHEYEKHRYSGIEVDFSDEGYYYDPAFGPNWWSYYCEPIKYGKKVKKIRHVKGDPPGSPGWIEHNLTRDQAKFYIDKYIHLKPYIHDLINHFIIENFSGYYIISVHYRGTDKLLHDAKEVSYNDVSIQIDQIIQKKEQTKVRIFVATDEQNFLNYIILKYGKIVCFNQFAERSSDGKPLHINNKTPYKQGLDAILDMILLSKGDYLIRTTSNLSRWSTFFSPNIPVYELSQLDFH